MAGRAEGPAVIDTQKRVPPQPGDPLKQPASIQPAIGEYDHGPSERYRAMDLTEHPQPLGAPRLLDIRRQHGPGDGNGTPPVDDADHQYRKPGTQSGGIED